MFEDTKAGHDSPLPEDENTGTERPANPEMDNVAANRPNPQDAAAPTPAAEQLHTSPKTEGAREVPRKIEKESGKKKSNTRFLLGCAGGLLLLFVLFVILMVFVMSRGAGDNAVIAAFGLAPGAVKGFLLIIINLAFGFLSLVFFVLMVIGIFKLASSKKHDKEKRNQAARMVIFSLIPFFLLLIIWFFLYNFINQLEVPAEKVVAEIMVIDPENVSSLKAPIEITLSAIKVKQALASSRLGVSTANWDLDGDGYFETPVNATGEVTRLYQKRGLFNVGLQVQVAGEQVPRVYTMPLQITEALFSAEPSSGTAPLKVQFDAAHLLPETVKVESLDWDFDGDGRYDVTGANKTNPFYVFERIGTYSVHLRIVDENDTVENYYRDIDIAPSDTPLLSARIEVTPGLKGNAPFSVRFDGGSSSSLKGKIVRYEWNFGDGSGLQEGKSVSYVYNTPGIYNVTLSVMEDSGKTSEFSVNVSVQSVSSKPKAVILTTPASEEGLLTGALPLKVSFDASASTDADNDIVDYKWDFDGNSEPDKSGKKVSYTFEEAGEFQVMLEVSDSENQTDTTTLNVVVEEPGVQAVISADPSEGTVPLTVRFDGSGSSAYRGSIVSYEWNFGDGSDPTITGATINHRYDSVGTYEASLTVTTNQSEKATGTQQIFIREIPLKACFEPSRATGVAPLSVTFDPKCSTGGIENYHWDFGDGIESASRKPAHTFESPGTYTVTLEVADDKSNISSFTEVIVAEGDVIE